LLTGCAFTVDAFIVGRLTVSTLTASVALAARDARPLLAARFGGRDAIADAGCAVRGALRDLRGPRRIFGRGGGFGDGPGRTPLTIVYERRLRRREREVFHGLA
jgi:hypothetical protein